MQDIVAEFEVAHSLTHPHGSAITMQGHRTLMD